MPTYQQACIAACTADAWFSDTRPVAQYNQLPPCPACGGPTERVYLPPSAPSAAAPIVVYRGPDGELRVPGTTGGSAMYERLGYERIELRGVVEGDRFARAQNQREFSRASRQTEQKQMAREMRERVQRGDLRMAMQGMSNWGRDVARAAMAANDNKPRERTADPGCHFEVHHYDRGSRDGGRDERGRRMRD